MRWPVKSHYQIFTEATPDQIKEWKKTGIFMMICDAGLAICGFALGYLYATGALI